MTRTRIAALVFAAALAGCAAPDLYEWGDYEPSLYALWCKPGSFDLGVEMARLEAEIRDAQAEGRRVAPGLQAHLGWMHETAGDRAAATRWLEAEKRDYPDSTAFVDGLLSRAQQ